MPWIWSYDNCKLLRVGAGNADPLEEQSVSSYPYLFVCWGSVCVCVCVCVNPHTEVRRHHRGICSLPSCGSKLKLPGWRWKMPLPTELSSHTHRLTSHHDSNTELLNVSRLIKPIHKRSEQSCQGAHSKHIQQHRAHSKHSINTCHTVRIYKPVQNLPTPG